MLKSIYICIEANDDEDLFLRIEMFIFMLNLTFDSGQRVRERESV